MTQINVYLFFDGNCADAVQFYAAALGGTPQIMKAKEMPDGGGNVPPERREQVMHARLEIDGGGVLMASDWMDTAPYPGMRGFRACLTPASAADGQRMFDALAAGGSVDAPFGPTFWSPGFGMLTDRFGVQWMVNSASSDRMPLSRSRERGHE